VPPPAAAADAFENDENDDVVEDGDTECEVAPIPPLFQTVTFDHWPEYQQQLHCPHKNVTPLPVPTHEEVMAGDNKEEDTGTEVSDSIAPVPPCCQTVTAEHWPIYKHSRRPSLPCQQQHPPSEHEERVVKKAWKVSASKLKGKDAFLTSPKFDCWEGVSLMVILRPYPSNVRGGFKGSKGVGKVELKLCDGTRLSEKANICYRVAAGKNKELPFQGLEHNFAAQPLSILPQEWQFWSAVGGGVLLLHLEARMQWEGT
jgi:hypothetical protein